MKTFMLIVFACTASFLQSCDDESNLQVIEPKTGWEVQNSGTKMSLTDVFFIDENTGWVVSVIDSILKTTDGGKNWKRYYCKYVKDYGSIHFTDINNGWLLGSDGNLMHSTDGGETWNEVKYCDDIALYNVSTISFSTPTTAVFSVGEGDIYFTHDGGNTWSERKGKDKDFIKSIAFSDDLHAWAYGTHNSISGYDPDDKELRYVPFLLVTKDGGQTWQEVENDSLQFSSLQFINNTTGWAYIGEGNLLQTRDAGRTWRKQYTHSEARIYDIFFTDEIRGWLVEGLPQMMGAGNKYYTIKQTKDGGETWQYQNMPVELNKNKTQLTDIYFVNANVGWALGTGGVIWHTTTGGEPD